MSLFVLLHMFIRIFILFVYIMLDCSMKLSRGGSDRAVPRPRISARAEQALEPSPSNRKGRRRPDLDTTYGNATTAGETNGAAAQLTEIQRAF